MIDIASNEDLILVTGYRRRREQFEWLKNCGLPVKRNAAGELLVHKSVIEKWLGVSPSKYKNKELREPNFNLI